MRQPNSTGAIVCAQNVWDGYKNIGSILRKENIEKVGISLTDMMLENKSPVDIAEPAYDLSVSLSQGAKAKKGFAVNKIVANEYSAFFGSIANKIETEVRVRNTRKADVDVMLDLPGGLIFISITTIPQERKDGTWRSEHEYVETYVKNNPSMHRRDYTFIGMFMEGGTNCSLESTIRKREALRDNLRIDTVVIAAHDIKNHADRLKELIGKYS